MSKMDVEDGQIKDRSCLICLDDFTVLPHTVICAKGCNVHVCPACIHDAYAYGRCFYCKELIDRIVDQEGRPMGVRCSKCLRRASKLLGILLLTKALMHMALF